MCWINYIIVRGESDRVLVIGRQVLLSDLPTSYLFLLLAVWSQVNSLTSLFFIFVIRKKKIKWVTHRIVVSFRWDDVRGTVGTCLTHRAPNVQRCYYRTAGLHCTWVLCPTCLWNNPTWQELVCQGGSGSKSRSRRGLWLWQRCSHWERGVNGVTRELQKPRVQLWLHSSLQMFLDLQQGYFPTNPS